MIEPLISKYFQDLHDSKITYQSSPNEGECILKQISPIKKIIWKYYVYILLSILTLGLFALAVFWYPKLQRLLFYNCCNLSQATHFLILNYDNQYTIAEKIDSQQHFLSQKQSQKVTCFVNRYMKYIIQKDGIVKAVNFQYRKRIANIFKNNKLQGLGSQQAQKLKLSYGPGTMIIQKPSLLILFARQVFRPLYLFIIFSVILWFYQQYIYYSVVILVTSTISIAINLYQVRQFNQKIFQMAYYDIPVNVLRKDTVCQISSVSVVPGDIVFLKQNIKIPFEGIILEGTALINECALTGQSVPIVKKADVLHKYSNENIQLDRSAYIFQGTTIIQVNMKKKMIKYEPFRQAFGIPVCVIRTNFSTQKGQLIRIISFPKEQQNEFQKQSSKFLIFLFCLCTVSYCLLVVRLYDIVTTKDIILKFLDLVTITVPPGLPVSMTFGIIFALQKLKNKQIFCISPNKIIAGGRVKLACFDKTGTLTQDFMDFYGLVPCYNQKVGSIIQSTFQKSGIERQKITDILAENPHIISALGNMASNHSIIQIQSTGQLIGDPMQIKLFQFGQFELDFSHTNPDVVFSYSSKRNHKGTIYRRFQFDSDVQRMSVIASNSMMNNYYYCYCKGSPEILLQIMNKSTIPENYHEILKQYTSHGFRVLTIASKRVSSDPKNLSRDEAEKDLTFDGFEIFQNKLKKQTYNAIQELKGAGLECVMITGDNSLTGSNIAYKCQIANLQKKMLICDYKNSSFQSQEFIYRELNSNQQQRKQRRQYLLQNKQSQQQNGMHSDVEMQSVEMTDLPKNTIQLKQIKQHSKTDHKAANYSTDQHFQSVQFMEKTISKAKYQNFQLCLTGSAFNKLLGSLTALTTLTGSIDPLIRQFISFIAVYARTKPNDKAKIVSLYQQLGNVVVMCGDGANDCGALKQADIGLSLSQAEASISAPFTSKVINISAVVELIKQCRAGLATNFSLFNIMTLYSLIVYTMTIILQYFYAYPADLQYLYLDLGGNFFFFLTFGYTGTVPYLSRHIPSSSLFSFSNIFQVIFMFLVQLIGQIYMITIISGQFSNSIDYYNNGGQIHNRARFIEQQRFANDTPQTNVLFLFVNFMLVFSLLGFSISKPWRTQFWTNIPFMVVLVLYFTYSVIICVIPELRLRQFCMSWLNVSQLNWFILEKSLLFGLFIYFAQKIILQPVSAWLRQKNPTKSWL